MLIVSRFAPSPTGRLHLGHALSAVRAHDLARAGGGRFLLRIEDIDLNRSRTEHVAGIVEDLTWLGLRWDGEAVFQSRRTRLYEIALDKLRKDSLVYPCFCTRAQVAAEIAASASAPHGPDGALYPGTCRRLNPAERDARGVVEPHAWRLDMRAAVERTRVLEWRDAHAGEIMADPAQFGDVVIARRDAPSSYHLAVTVDDAAQGVTDVVRGNDLFAASHVHRLLQALLNLPTPLYHHHPLIAGGDGKRLAKRAPGATIADIRAGGMDGKSLADMLRAGRLPAGYSLIEH